MTYRAVVRRGGDYGGGCRGEVTFNGDLGARCAVLRCAALSCAVLCTTRGSAQPCPECPALRPHAAPRSGPSPPRSPAAAAPRPRAVTYCLAAAPLLDAIAVQYDNVFSTRIAQHLQ